MLRFLATLRCTFEAEDEMEAALIADQIALNAGADLEEGEDTVDVTQVIPFEQRRAVEPSELINEMRLVADKLVTTRIKECYELASWLDKTAWLLEHRSDEPFEMTGYDYGAFLERSMKTLKHLKEVGR